MRQHTAFRVGRTTRCRRLSDGVVRNHDIPRLNSRVTIIRIQRDKGRTSPPPGFPVAAGKGVSAVMRGPGDLPGVPGTGAPPRRPSWPLRAVRVPSGQLAGRPQHPPQAARRGRPRRGGWRGGAPRGRGLPRGDGGRESEARGAGAGPGNRAPAGAPWPRGYASLCWPASDPAVRSRAVWGRQGDWLSGRAPRSHRGGHWFDPSIAHQPRCALCQRAARADRPPLPHCP